MNAWERMRAAEDARWKRQGDRWWADGRKRHAAPDWSELAAALLIVAVIVWAVLR